MNSPHNAASSPELVRAMAPVARELLGAPNVALSNETDLRFGSNGSISVDPAKGVWYSHEDNLGGNVIELLRSRLGYDKDQAIRWLRDRGYLLKESKGKPKAKIEKVYSYQSEDAQLLYQVVRYAPKSFRQRRPDGSGGWIWNMKGFKRVLYRLPEVVAAAQSAQTIYVVEGEKSADTLAAMGVAATCSPGGAGKWNTDYGNPLLGANVVILPDNDEAGQAHARLVSKCLVGIARNIVLLDMPDLSPKGDVHDWVGKGGTIERLEGLVRSKGRIVQQIERQADLRKGATAAPIGNFDLTEDSLALAFNYRYDSGLRYDHDAVITHPLRRRAISESLCIWIALIYSGSASSN